MKCVLDICSVGLYAQLCIGGDLKKVTVCGSLSQSCVAIDLPLQLYNYIISQPGKHVLCLVHALVRVLQCSQLPPSQIITLITCHAFHVLTLHRGCISMPNNT